MVIQKLNIGTGVCHCKTKNWVWRINHTDPLKWTQKNPWTDELIISLRNDSSWSVASASGVSWQHLTGFHRGDSSDINVTVKRQKHSEHFSIFNSCNPQNSFWFQKKKDKAICLIIWSSPKCNGNSWEALFIVFARPEAGRTYYFPSSEMRVVLILLIISLKHLHSRRKLRSEMEAI